ncbi:type IV pilin protein [Halopseudomonas yangmingensis]|uniref:Type IV pilus assembly protein PilE n=1 Tax=Halopseudomonas yangmingensis TaxID=1720063 RepID=A0A1I4NZX1_9GAMM|nr:type IV pilin protein [Halopseudomonas yangmingensis]SFM21062.1 type IV pilus assembly protein PilE [Halopseudomonas yangmingensis]
MKPFCRYNGFTLIEIMIVVAIIGIIASIAYPSYAEYVRDGKRAEGKTLLVDAAARQERFYAQNGSYVTTNATLSQLNLQKVEHYNLTVAKVADDGGYSLTATPAFSDPKCGNLTLTANGTKGNSGTKDANYCW